MATSNTSPKRRGTWSKKELEYLKNNYGNLTMQEIAKRLNRSYTSVKSASARNAIGRDKQREYAVYFDDEYQFSGTAQECADQLGIRVASFVHYTTPSYKNRAEKGMHVVDLGFWKKEESV